jgi:hypothetical protein
MPGKKRIRCHQRFDFIERSSAKDFSFYGQSYPLFIGEPKALTIKLILENTVFFNQIVDNSLLLAVKPAGQGDDQKLKGMYDVRHC